MTRSQKRNLIRLLIVLVLFLAVFITDKVIDLNTVFDSELSYLFPLSLYLVLYLAIGYDVILKAIRNISHGQIFDENFLMLIATIGAFATFEFEEAVAVLVFYQFGEFFQDYAVNRSRNSIKELMEICPTYANKIVDGSIEVVLPEEVKVGDVLLVKPGEKVPLDGIVKEGASSLDTRALTGESALREIEVGQEILSGSINIESDLEIEVTKEFSNSTVSKILELVENASSNKAKAENFISKFAKFYTPIVCLLALLLVVIPGSITGDWMTWLTRSLNFLVVSCPCALVISIPLSFFSGIGIASKNGILIKGSNYIEKLNKANIFIFDKTGTLTEGDFEVSKVYPEDKKDEILSLAAIAESKSNHPIANSIKKAYVVDDNLSYSLTNVQGRGIIAKKDDEVILCGNAKLLKENGIEFKEADEIGSVIYVAKNNIFLGYIVVQDKIKEESKEVISYLNSKGKTIMLTGDNSSVANKVASYLNLTSYKASLLPQDKVKEVENIIKNKGKNDVVCYVGDGINDAPSLMIADVGISMGKVGSDAAIEASDVVITNDNLTKIKLSKRIAKKVITIVNENIYFAIGVKVLVLILSALGYAEMWLAIFADVGVSFLAILNSLRVNLIKK
ncbi:MAG: heavy metal translocating P-type ATPase [Bacilli bacterium]|nr:heavy metal translocating P-type ATPase [Bacilli bacterium]MDY5654816.1 heavy metal translocating P-type ATPase [Bacilli bacterium]MDY5937394.1 heavy metal translocating P-type ATPase [Bacilli bacterium]MDY6009109.1 heavy metal translocating P-type ATPase [Bacilli bacterium]MDY6048328.1 heavy metal translocating P-type ATPase [Bacilli bacterium]